jgi:hypothetical protein
MEGTVARRDLELGIEVIVFWQVEVASNVRGGILEERAVCLLRWPET